MKNSLKIKKNLKMHCVCLPRWCDDEQLDLEKWFMFEKRRNIRGILRLRNWSM